MSDLNPTRPAALFAAALQELAQEYPTDPDGTATVPITVTDPQTGEQHQAHVEPGQLDWITSAVMDLMATFRNAHADGSGQCGHCAGSGKASPA
ncbi:hypothetical protein [Streptomyces malaysiensis]|uniref:hypothetical protein n=1 Tax=Streptomyces malaysiensis TaxID=92644 RepID=UPI000BFC7F78|nr:hypothetical protein [Streptomyces malaysiensis]ATL88771.1 hypothetical protein SMALA_8625 [Streptomyces malaysiensis]